MYQRMYFKEESKGQLSHYSVARTFICALVQLQTLAAQLLHNSMLPCFLGRTCTVIIDIIIYV